MIKIRALEVKPYGLDYIVRIGEATVMKHGGKLAMGYERDFIITPDRDYSLLKNRLTIQNISGDYYLISPNVALSQWLEVFAVKIVKHV